MTLRDDILNDRDCDVAYAARDCTELARIRSIGRTRNAPILIADIQKVLQTSGVWWNILDTANAPTHPARAAARAVIDVASARYDSVDSITPIVGQMFGALVTASILPHATMTKIMGMGIVAYPYTAQDVVDAVFNDDGSAK